MKVKEITPPRTFEVGWEEKILLSDCAHITLAADEQVSFLTEQGGEYDVVRKNWGFYVTPSINGRLSRFGFRSVLVKNRVSQFFLLLVEKGKEDAFEEYRKKEALECICYLDDEDVLKQLSKTFLGS